MSLYDVILNSSVEYSQKRCETLCGSSRAVKMQRVAQVAQKCNVRQAAGQAREPEPIAIWREVTRSRILNASKHPPPCLIRNKGLLSFAIWKALKIYCRPKL